MRIVWFGILLLIFSSASWYIFKAGKSIYHYKQLSEEVPVLMEKVEVEKLRENSYAILARFSYSFNQKDFQAEARLSERYPNPWAAESALRRIEGKSGVAWLNPNRPQQVTLERSFPYKTTISGVVLIGLMIYFMILGYFIVAKWQKQN